MPYDAFIADPRLFGADIYIQRVLVNRYADVGLLSVIGQNRDSKRFCNRTNPK